MAEKIVEIEDLRTVTRTGTVVRCQVWSDTRVSGGSNASTSWVGPQGGHVSTPQVSITSTTTENQQLFIRQDDGLEFDQRFINTRVAIRDGARVSIVYVPDQDGEPLAVINHNTGKSQIFENRVQKLLGAKPGNPLLGLLVPAYMLALVPLHLATWYFSFTGRMDHLEPMLGRGLGGIVEWTLWNGLLIAGIIIIGSLGPGVRKGLKAEVIETVRQRAHDAMESERDRTPQTEMTPA